MITVSHLMRFGASKADGYFLTSNHITPPDKSDKTVQIIEAISIGFTPFLLALITGAALCP